MKPLRLRPLHQSRAEALASALERHDEEPALRDLAQELRALLTPREMPKRERVVRRVVRAVSGLVRWSTKKLRLFLWARAEGHCDNGACDIRITWGSFHLDHYLGRARAPQSPENCWALCWRCHERKHAADPSRHYWHEVFLLHLEVHGLGCSETAKGIRDELAAEEKLLEAQRHAALAVSTAGDLVERARRAEGAAS